MRDGTLTNREKPFQARGKPFQAREKPFQAREKPFQARGKYLSSKGKIPFQARGKTFPSKGKIPFKQGEKPFQAREKHQQARKTPFGHSTNKKNTFQARSCLSSKGYLPIKCRSLQVVGVFRQGKAVVSDGRYGVIGG